ncbi:MAG: hypothetical protein ACRDCW_10995 [Sarcina sp.]
MKKGLVLIILGSVLCSNINVFASTNTNTNDISKGNIENINMNSDSDDDVEGKKLFNKYGINRSLEESEIAVLDQYSYKVEELLKNDPKFREDIEKGAKLVGVDDLYVKYTLKETSKNVKNKTVNDYTTETFTYTEYLNELKEDKQKALIGDFVQPECSWLNLYMGVVDYGDGLFSASSYFNWKGFPVFTFTDGHGIAVDSGFTIITDAPGNYSEYVATTNYNGANYVNTKSTMEFETRGSFSLVPLQTTHNGAMVATHHGKHQIVFETNNTNIRSGNVYNNYLHKDVGVGSIGMSEDGLLNISGVVVSKTHKGAVTIRNI